MNLLEKLTLCTLILLLAVSCGQPKPVEVKYHPPREQQISRGVWVTVFSKEKVLYSKDGQDRLIRFCNKNGINDIYLQILRAGEAYYDSQILGPSKYETMVKEFGADPIDALLQKAQKNKVKIHAWINVLSLAQNKKAPILQKYGKSVLTRDKGLRVSIRGVDINDSDTYYLRDDQLFLEPGDERVVDYMARVVAEIATRYPGFSGMHLDYIRYPYPVPFVPDSRFLNYGITYGFGERNLERFKEATGFNPRAEDPFQKDLYLKWDQWKREQVTHLVRSISVVIRGKASGWRISCAAVPTLERAYSIAFQDWPLWLNQGLVDYAVLMNYTRDERLLEQSVRAAMGFSKKDKIQVGIGAFLFKKREDFLRNYTTVRNLKPSGIVFFSYDDMLGLSMEVKKRIEMTAE